MKGVVAVFAAAIVALILLAYQSPRVQELFRSAPPRPVATDRPVPGFEEGEKVETPAEKSAQPRPGTPKPDRRRAVKPTPARQAAAPPAKPPKPSVSNSEVTLVLSGIFAAQGIQGLALSVTDDVIEVSGQVASEEQRKKVLATLEKARETRRIEAAGLTVAGR